MMDQKKKQEINKTADFIYSRENHISIQLSLDGFSFCILNENKNQIEKLRHFSFEDQSPTPEKHLKNVKNLFEAEKELQQRYNTVSISHVNQLSGLVPKPLFDETRMKDYIKYSSNTFDNDYIVFAEIANHDLNNVYIPFDNVNNNFLDRYGSSEYKHFSTVLIKSLLDTFKFSEHPHMFAHIRERQFELVVIANNKLLLYNSFNYQEKEDFIYYVLFTAEQLGLNREKFELMLSGNVTKEGPLFALAYKYIRKVSLLENRFKFNFPEKVTEASKRKEFTLLNQY